jgi:hypothetical protein
MIDFGIQGILATLFVWLAYWRKDIFLYMLAIPSSLMFGFAWYERYPDNMGLVMSVTIIAVGVYSFWKVIENLIERIRG